MKRILVIDDEDSVRQVIVEALEMQGWRLLEAGDGEEGLRRAVEELPDMVLCDIQMPKLDGYGVLRGVRENPTLATIPFLFLTGHGDKPRMRQAMEMGADDYIVKPFTIPELLAAVEARFQKQAVIEESADKRLEALRESLRFALPHELVTPLNSVLGFAGLLLEDTQLNREQIQEYATHIREAGERLRSLIEKFLVYAQVELAVADDEQRAACASRKPSATEEVMNTTAQRVAQEQNRTGDLLLQVSAVAHAISPSHLERLVRELVENAFKFSRPGDPVRVISRIDGREFAIEVMDRGPGFTPEQIRQVSANVQFDRKMSEQQGTGLGLAIARRIAQLYGGDLAFQSRPGERTTVMVRLPV